MALPNLSGSNIQDTYQRVLHTDGTLLYNGTGSVISTLNVTASHAVIETTKEISSSYAETASMASNNFTVQGSITGSHRMFITSSGGNAKILLDDNDGSPTVNFRTAGTQKGVIGYRSTDTYLKFVAGTTLMNNTGIVMNSSGQIGVGEGPHGSYQIKSAGSIYAGGSVYFTSQLVTATPSSFSKPAMLNSTLNKGFYLGEANSDVITFIGSLPDEEEPVDKLVSIDYSGTITASGHISSSMSVFGHRIYANNKQLILHGYPLSNIISSSLSHLVVASKQTQFSDSETVSLESAKNKVAIRTDSDTTPALYIQGQTTASGHISSSGFIFGNRFYMNGQDITQFFCPFEGHDHLTTVGHLDSGQITSGFDSIDVGSGFIKTTGPLSGGSITASVSITSSGNVYANNYYSNDVKVVRHNNGVTNFGTSGGNGTFITGSYLKLGNDAGFHITASGDISASGTIKGQRIAAAGEVIAGGIISTTNNIYADGNISASGNVYAANIILPNDGIIAPSVNHQTIKFMTKPPGTSDNGERLTLGPDLIEFSGMTGFDTNYSLLRMDMTDGSEIIQFNASENDVDFKIHSDHTTAMVMNAEYDAFAFRDHVGIGHNANKWPTDDYSLSGAFDKQLMVSGLTHLTGSVEIVGPITTDITASGNISASGTITATGNISTAGNMSADYYNSTTSATGFKLNGAKYLWLTSSDLQVGNDAADTDIIGTSINLQSPVTASGDISASGTIYGRQFEQIMQNFTADITSYNTDSGFGTVYLPWTDNDTEKDDHSNKFVNKVASVPGRPVRTIVRALSNWDLAGGTGDKATRQFTASFHTQKSFENSANTVDRMSCYTDSRKLGTSLDAREHLVFDWRNPNSGSVGDCDVGDKVWMTIRSNNEEETQYMVTTIFEWDYGSLI